MLVGRVVQGRKMNTYLLASLVCIFAVAVYYFVFKLQLFKSINVEKMKIPAFTIVYTKYRGNYHNMMPVINQMKADFEAYFISKGLQDKFKSQKFAGIYYDDPSMVVDPNEERAVLGAMFSSSDMKKFFDVQEFLSFTKKKLEYSALEQSPITSFGFKFPLYNVLSLCSALFRGYPKLKEYGTANKLMAKALCSMEIYDWNGHEITVCFPYGKASETMLYLSGYPCPKYKSQ